MKKVNIIGAGIGGLCTAIRLLHKGYEVTLYEKNSLPGGCIHYTSSPDHQFKIDTSASLPINPLTYEEIFKDVGHNPKDYFDWTFLDTHYKVFFPNQKSFSFKSNLIQTQKEIDRHYPFEAEGYTQFVFDTGLKYIKAKNSLLNQSFLTKKQIFHPNVLKNILQLETLTSASEYVKSYISSKQLRELILFQTFFMGISPYRIPNIYTSIAAQTQLEGLAHITGGLSAYIKALEKLCSSLGGKIFYNHKVDEFIYNHRTIKYLKINNNSIPAHLVICNADYLTCQSHLLARKKCSHFDLSCSTFIIHLGLTKKFKSLDVHNLYLNKNFRKEIRKVFDGILPHTPSLYIYYPSAQDNSFCKNPSHSVMNIMIRVPNLHTLDISWDAPLKDYLYHYCLKTIKTIPGLEGIEKYISYCTYTTPNDFENDYNYFKGVCFGIGHTFFQSMAFRPQIKDPYLSNLYYVGSSIHPGNGASIVMDGAKLLANELDRLS